MDLLKVGFFKFLGYIVNKNFMEATVLLLLFLLKENKYRQKKDASTEAPFLPYYYMGIFILLNPCIR